MCVVWQAASAQTTGPHGARACPRPKFVHTRLTLDNISLALYIAVHSKQSKMRESTRMEEARTQERFPRHEKKENLLRKKRWPAALANFRESRPAEKPDQQQIPATVTVCIGTVQ